MGKFKLFNEILALSQVDDWEDARLEWKLDSVYESDEPLSCICGHYPIINICTLKNLYNGRYVDVGNECVKKFFKIDEADAILSSIKKVKQNRSKSISIATLNYLYKKHVVTKWEYDFYTDIHKKRQLTLKQETKKREINEKFLAFTKYTKLD